MCYRNSSSFGVINKMFVIKIEKFNYKEVLFVR